MGNSIDMNYSIPLARIKIQIKHQHLVQRTACRSPGHMEEMALIESVMDGVAAKLSGHRTRCAR